MSKLFLNRQILENITNNNQEAIKALERVFSDVSVVLPEQFETAINQATQAVSAANQALGILANLADMLERLALAPAAVPVPEYEDLRPAIQLGSISIQEADNVDITGGTIGLSAGTVALPSFYLVDRATGLYRVGANSWGMSIAGVNLVTYSATGAAFTQNVSTTKQLVSTVATGTAPLSVASTTPVANLAATTAATVTTAAQPAITSTGVLTTLSALVSAAISFITSLTGTAAGSNRLLNLNGQASGRDVHMGFSDGVNASGRIGYYNSGDMYMWTGGVQRMTWNISGNCMLGTTTDGMSPGGSLAVALDFAHRGSLLGVFNSTPTGKKTITGSRAGNAALASLLTQGALYGLWTDSTTP